MKPVDAQLLEAIDRYIELLCAPADTALTACLDRARAAGLPHINVSPVEGKLLYVITRLSRAQRVLEIGTLGGYSTIWLARALPPGGTVVTLELSPDYASIARDSVAAAVSHVTIDVRVGDAAASLGEMILRREPPFDVVFIDADKPSYVRYLNLALQLSHPGTVILADNVIRHGAVLEPAVDDPSAQGARAYNTAIAAHSRLESVIVPALREKVDGLSIAIVK
ncbi:MAG TPA: O-methyltransferase [Vicinamibacterales bacterium]|nr:O-methyltransferase [Vicinamibacterales bacterium]